VLKEKEERQANGKVFTKLELGDYHWMRFSEVNIYADEFGKGIRELGVRPREHICIFADTRAEWLIAAIGCFKNAIALCTIYTNLGGEGIVHGINQTSVDTVITTVELMPKLLPLLKDLPQVKTIIYMESATKPQPEDISGVKMYSFQQVLLKGRSSNLQNDHPKPEDTAIIMYTSGSTGVPKGVVLSHINMVSGVLSLTPMALRAVPYIDDTDSYIAFLPLAHVLEICAEHVMLLLGIKIGYSSPNTLTDTSTMIPEGGKGDATLLQPTLMAAVPLILDRVYKGIQNKIKDRGEFSERLVNYCIEYRQYWVSKGFSTPLMDRLIFAKMKAAVGGRLRVMLSGGAPIAEDAHRFIRTVLTTPLMQGYGLTETCSTGCIADPMDLTTGHVGPPVNGVTLKLVDWTEGGYTVDDEVGPRGEIVIGGDHVSAGYFNMPEKTAEEFYEEDGQQFFRTGDIGQMLVGRNCQIKIIDRKKDLVKLQMGEYVSLGKVEANLKINPLIENVCLYADSTKNFTVAVVVPDEAKLRELAESRGLKDKEHNELCADPRMNLAVMEVLQAQAKVRHRGKITSMRNVAPVTVMM